MADHGQPRTSPPSPTRKPTGPKPLLASVGADVKFAIRFRYLTDKSSLADLAQEFGLSTYQISKVLDGPEYTAMRESLQKVQVQQAQDKLAATMETAAQEWAKAIPIAAKMGKHGPARDLLLATGAIKPHGSQSGPSITVNVGVSGDGVVVNLGGPAHAKLPAPSPAPAVVTIDPETDADPGQPIDG